MLWGYDFFFQRQAVILNEDEAQMTKTFPDNKDEIREARAKRKELEALEGK